MSFKSFLKCFWVCFGRNITKTAPSCINIKTWIIQQLRATQLKFAITVNINMRADFKQMTKLFKYKNNQNLTLKTHHELWVVKLFNINKVSEGIQGHILAQRGSADKTVWESLS